MANTLAPLPARPRNPAPAGIATSTSLRAASLLVVVGWHWMFRHRDLAPRARHHQPHRVDAGDVGVHLGASGHAGVLFRGRLRPLGHLGVGGTGRGRVPPVPVPPAEAPAPADLPVPRHRGRGVGAAHGGPLPPAVPHLRRAARPQPAVVPGHLRGPGVAGPRRHRAGAPPHRQLGPGGPGGRAPSWSTSSGSTITSPPSNGSTWSSSGASPISWDSPLEAVDRRSPAPSVGRCQRRA